MVNFLPRSDSRRKSGELKKKRGGDTAATMLFHLMQGSLFR
jgi:hypothetical protein